MSADLIPRFPQFAVLENHHQQEINRITAEFPPYSDFNFISLWSWGFNGGTSISKLGDNLVVIFSDYINPKDKFISLLGRSDITESLQQVISYCENNGLQGVKLLPEIVVEQLAENKNSYDFAEDPDNFDYILDLGRSAKLAGKDYESKRRALNKFLKKYDGSITSKTMDPSHPYDAAQAITLTQTWIQDNTQDEKEKNNELGALKKLLYNIEGIDVSNLHIQSIYIHDKLAAFSVNEITSQDYAIGHFKKFDKSYEGIGVVLDFFTFSDLYHKGVKKINIEQDLGIDGLRTSKRRWSPEGYLKKYSIRPAE